MSKPSKACYYLILLLFLWLLLKQENEGVQFLSRSVAHCTTQPKWIFLAYPSNNNYLKDIIVGSFLCLSTQRLEYCYFPAFLRTLIKGNIPQPMRKEQEAHPFGKVFVYKHWRQISFDFQICQPPNKRTLSFANQEGSGWHINNNRWHHRYLRYVNF